MRLKREETIVAIVVESSQEIGPAPLTFASRCQNSIGAHIFYMYIYEPGREKVVGVWIGHLAALQEVRQIEDGA